MNCMVSEAVTSYVHVYRYWEIDPADCETCQHHKPYRIEVIGVTCDPGLAVARGVWRKLRTGRSVRSATLLRSHRLFSEHYERTAHLVDVATLYHTGNTTLTCICCICHAGHRGHALTCSASVYTVDVAGWCFACIEFIPCSHMSCCFAACNHGVRVVLYRWRAAARSAVTTMLAQHYVSMLIQTIM